MRAIFTLIISFIPVFCFSQIETNSVISYQAKSLYVSNGKCLDGIKLLQFDEDRLISFISSSRCLNSTTYVFKVLVNGVIHHITPENAHFNIESKKLIKWFKRLDEGEQAQYQTNAETTNRKYTDSVNIIKAEKKRLEEERVAEEQRLQKIQAEKERKLAEEQKARSKAAINDSINISGIERIMLNIDSIETGNLDIRLQESKLYHQLISKFRKEFGGVLIKNFKVFTPEYSGTGVDFTIFNCSDQSLKYVDFFVQGYNAVGDKVGSLEKLRGIGFIEPFSEGSWNFENVWYQNTLSSGRLKTILVTYKDGRTKNITVVNGMFLSDVLSEEGMMDAPLIYDYTVIGSVSLRDYSGVYSLEIADVRRWETSPFVFTSKEAKEMSLELSGALEAIINESAFKGKYFALAKYSTTISINIMTCSTLGALTVEHAKELKLKLDGL